MIGREPVNTRIPGRNRPPFASLAAYQAPAPYQRFQAIAISVLNIDAPTRHHTARKQDFPPLQMQGCWLGARAPGCQFQPVRRCRPAPGAQRGHHLLWAIIKASPGSLRQGQWRIICGGGRRKVGQGAAPGLGPMVLAAPPRRPAILSKRLTPSELSAEGEEFFLHGLTN